MKGRINKKGILEILRGRTYKRQICIRPDIMDCDDNCPMFGEPCKDFDGIHTYKLQICNGRVLEFTELIDER